VLTARASRLYAPQVTINNKMIPAKTKTGQSMAAIMDTSTVMSIHYTLSTNYGWAILPRWWDGDHW
jgi:hypothetical protein